MSARARDLGRRVVRWSVGVSLDSTEMAELLCAAKMKKNFSIEMW